MELLEECRMMLELAVSSLEKAGLDTEHFEKTVAKIKETQHSDVVGQSEQLCDLDGKTVRVKFKVTKHIPKIIIEDI